MRRTITLIAVGLLVLCTALFIADERNRAALLVPEGVVDHGEKFGVSVGESREMARGSLLSGGFGFEGSQVGGRCVRHAYEPTEMVDVFSDRSWRSGTVCVISRDSRVVAVDWLFMPMTPEL
jgi:hypothetical protein